MKKSISIICICNKPLNFLGKRSDVSDKSQPLPIFSQLLSRDRAGQTERFLLEVWKTTFARLQVAVVEHIELTRKVYTKFGNEGQPVGMEANVTLFEGLDIYVEMKIRCGYLVILAAHSHYTKPLPQ